MQKKIRLMVIGAHPDDAEYKAGGLAALYRRMGHDVLFVSLTDGSAGHQVLRGPELAERRRAEAAASGATAGVTYEVWDNPDGRIEPNLALRAQVIRAVRRYQPDLLLTHRPNDYHPDHRVTSQVVQDSAYLLTVPAICPDVPALRRDPVIAYLSDDFSHPYPFTPSVIVDVADVWNEKVAMLDAHRSQFYDWLPYNGGYADEVPGNEDERREWLSKRMAELSQRLADRLRPDLGRLLGRERAESVSLIEAFEGCEYGAPLDEPARAWLFPFA